MTYEKLDEILSSGDPKAIIAALQKSSFEDEVPDWKKLVKEYEASMHSIWDPIKYPPKRDADNVDDFKRTALSLQKLAVKRVAQSMFATPVKRHYKTVDDTDASKEAIEALEELYRTRNYIDSENIDRAKMLNASCQIATVWSVIEKEQRLQNETLKFKLTHKTYSPFNGYNLYPIVDPFGEMLVLSIGFTDEEKVEHMYIYVNSYNNKKARQIFYDKLESGWVENAELSKDLDIFPVVYAKLPEPVWGGEDGTKIVEQLEEMESYQGLYIKRNALPTFTLDYGELPKGSKQANATEKSNDSRRVIPVGKGGKMSDVTWKGAGEAVNSRYERLRNAFFEQIQVPDTSFSNMIKSNTSAENKELVFADAKANARDLGGEWEKLLYEEMEIVKTIVSVMVSKYSSILESLSVRSVIQPYSIKTKTETADYVATAGDSMSTETKVRVLGEADDVEAEVEKIQSEKSANTNQLNL